MLHVVIAENCYYFLAGLTYEPVQFHFHTILSKFSHAHSAKVVCEVEPQNGGHFDNHM